MNNTVKSGRTVTLTAPSGGVVGGICYLIGKLHVVANASVAEGLPFEGEAEGEFELPKKSTDEFTEGCFLYWDEDPGELTVTAASGAFVGHATAAAANPSSTGRVRLAGGGSGVVSVESA